MHNLQLADLLQFLNISQKLTPNFQSQTPLGRALDES